jgi:hypothetical protein
MMKEWKVTYMTDYPFSDYEIISASSKEAAKNKFKKKMGFWDEFCCIKEI